MMKNTLLIFAIFLGITAFGQEQIEAIDSNTVTELKIGPCGIVGTQIYYNDGVPLGIKADRTRINLNEIIQPTETNELSNGTMPLSKELPYVHTIRGYAYTADYLRYTPRY
jgi:hypothetical protein